MKVVAVFLIFAFCSSSVLCGSIASRNVLDKGTEAFVRGNLEDAHLYITDKICLRNIVLNIIDLRIFDICISGLRNITVGEVSADTFIALRINKLELSLENLTLRFRIQDVNLDLDPLVNVTISPEIVIGLRNLTIRVKFDLIPGTLLGIVGVKQIGTTDYDFDALEIPEQSQKVINEILGGVQESLHKILQGVIETLGGVVTDIGAGFGADKVIKPEN